MFLPIYEQGQHKDELPEGAFGISKGELGILKEAFRILKGAFGIPKGDLGVLQ